MINNNIEFNNSTTHTNTVWLHDKNQLRNLLLDENMVEVISDYVSVYKENKGHWHPRISIEQLRRIENTLDDIGMTYDLSANETWKDVIDEYWISGNVGDGNINRFASGDWSQGVIAGLVK